MVTLRLLGGASLETDEGPVSGRSGQRRRVALLALLALSRTQPVSRDKIIGYLWPESDGEKARRLLSESLYVIRKALGEDSILATGDDLRLNREVVWSDVSGFLDALDQGKHEAAVELFRGPFMDGFFLSNAREFEDWVDSQRDDLNRRFTGALRLLAEEAGQASDPQAAVVWWRRLAAADRYDARTAVAYMQALEAVGQRAEALQHSRVHAALLKEEFDAEPDPSVEELADRLRNAPAPAVAPGSPGTAGRTMSGAGAPKTSAGTRGNKNRTLRFPRWAAGFSALLVLVATMAIVRPWLWPPSPPITPRGAERIVAVFPFALMGDVGSLFQSGGLETLLSQRMDVENQLRSVDQNRLMLSVEQDLLEEISTLQEAREKARALGATDWIQGSVVGSQDGHVEIAATMYSVDGQDQDPLEVRAEGPSEDPFSLADQVAGSFLSRLLEESGDHLSGAAALTTDSLSAFSEYLKGEEHFRATEYRLAYGAFDEAVKVDETFSLAHYRKSVAAMLGLQLSQHRLAARRAITDSHRLSPRYQRLVEAWDALLSGEAREAEDLYNQLLSDYPYDFEAHFGLGAGLFYYNPVRGRSPEEAVPHLEEVLELHPNFGQARFHLLELAAARKDTAAFEDLLSGVDPASDQALAWEAVEASWFGTEADLVEIEERLRLADSDAAGLAVARVAANLQAYPEAERFARVIADGDRDSDYRAGAFLLMGLTRLAQGRWSDGMDAFDLAARFDSLWAMELKSLYRVAFPLRQSTHAELTGVRSALLEWDGSVERLGFSYPLFAHNGYHHLLRWYLLSLASIGQGDLDQAGEFASKLGSEPGDREKEAIAGVWRLSLEARISAARGSTENAIGRLEELQGHLNTPLELVASSPFFARSLDRYELGRLQGEAGRGQEAIRWLKSLTEGYELVLVAPAHLEIARILDAGGRAEEAVYHYRRFLEFWENCDREFQDLVDEATDRIAHLTTALG